MPVALTPGFWPHDDVLVELPPSSWLALVLELVALAAPLAAVLDVLELLLLPHRREQQRRADQHGQRDARAHAQRMVVLPHLCPPPRNDSVDPPRFGEATDLIRARRLYATGA